MDTTLWYFVIDAGSSDIEREQDIHDFPNLKPLAHVVFIRLLCTAPWHRPQRIQKLRRRLVHYVFL